MTDPFGETADALTDALTMASDLLARTFKLGVKVPLQGGAFLQFTGSAGLKVIQPDGTSIPASNVPLRRRIEVARKIPFIWEQCASEERLTLHEARVVTDELLGFVRLKST